MYRNTVQLLLADVNRALAGGICAHLLGGVVNQLEGGLSHFNDVAGNLDEPVGER